MAEVRYEWPKSGVRAGDFQPIPALTPAGNQGPCILAAARLPQ